MVSALDSGQTLATVHPTRRELLERRRTRIVAILGPASNAEAALERLIDTGVDVFRLNCSHRCQEDHRDAFQRARAAAARRERPVAVLSV